MEHHLLSKFDATNFPIKQSHSTTPQIIKIPLGHQKVRFTPERVRDIEEVAARRPGLTRIARTQPVGCNSPTRESLEFYPIEEAISQLHLSNKM